jgi:hypothetical protein
MLAANYLSALALVSGSVGVADPLADVFLS